MYRTIIKKYWSELLVFSITAICYLPIIKYLGFRLNDDFHFFRSYSLIELIQAWYSNWNFTGIESDGYRPLSITTYHLVYSLLGFNDVRVMTFIVLINSILAVLLYRLARQFLTKEFAIAAALLTILLPKTLFKFTWTTEIVTTFHFAFMTISITYIILWSKTATRRYMYQALGYAIIASLYKETSYSLLLVIPILIFFDLITQNKVSVRKIITNRLLQISGVSFFAMLALRRFALQVYPDRLNPNYHNFVFHPSWGYFKGILEGIHSSLIIFFTPFIQTLSTLLSWSYTYDIFLGLGLLILPIIILINNKIFKKKSIEYSATFSLLLNVGNFLLYYYILNKQSNLLKHFSTLVIYLTYLTFFIFIGHILFKKKYRHYGFLILILITCVIPLVFGSYNRLRFLTNGLTIITGLILVEYLIQLWKPNNIPRYVVLTALSALIAIFSVRVFWYAVDQNKLLNLAQYSSILHDERWKEYNQRFRLSEQMQYARTMFAHSKAHEESIIKQTIKTEGSDKVYINNGSFEEDFSHWNQFIDCSPGNSGEASGSAELIDEAPDGNKALKITAHNHLICTTFNLTDLKTGHIYQLRFQSRSSVRRKNVDISDSTSLVVSKVFSLPLKNGWTENYIYFKARNKNNIINLYADPYLDKMAPKEPKTVSVFFDNVSLEEVTFVDRLNYGYLSVPLWINIPLFDAPFN